ncbi:MAG: peptidoglycan DD-metalloendopeptidase family protein [Gemmatimonadaceae bacterium]
MRPIPDRKAGTVLTGQRVPILVERIDTLGSGETITSLLERSGLSDDDARRAIAAAEGLDARRLRTGMKITLGTLGDTSPSQILLHLAVDRLLRLTKTDSGWVSTEERLPWTTDTLVIDGTIRSNLYDAFERGADRLPKDARFELAWSVADVFEYRLDMSRDLQEGDAFTVLVERQQTPTGVVRIGNVLAVDYAASSNRMRVFRLDDDHGKPRYFDENGKSMRAMFLRAPLEFRRISSVFGLRRHPILGVFRKHQGTDYAASSGTPVRAIGAGVVVNAGRMGGYGNAVDVRHPNGFVSRYGHLRAFAKGVQRGIRVGIGETIGYVGMTGLATAPHLHFEVLVGGVQRNPRVALSTQSGEPLAQAERPLFEQTKSQALAMLEQYRATVRAATP